MASLEKDDNPLKPIMTKQRWPESSLNPCWGSLKKKLTWYDLICVNMVPWCSLKYPGIIRYCVMGVFSTMGALAL